MRYPSVALAVAFLVVASLVPSPAIAEQPADNQAKPAPSAGATISTGLLVAAAAESAGAKLALTKPAASNAASNAGGNAGGNSSVPPGRRCDPNDPRPGCQPLPKSPKR